MSCALFKIDIINEIKNACDFNYKLCVIDKTIEELETILKEQKGKDKLCAEIAKQIIAKYKIKIIDTKDDNSYVDDILVKCSSDDVVATNDKELISRLKEKKIKVLRIKQKKFAYLE